MSNRFNKRDYMLWNSVLNEELAKNMVKKSRAESEDGESTENILIISKFFELVKTNISYKYGTNIAKVWHRFSDTRQVELSLEIMGEQNASRFLLMMDCLNYKIRKGRGEV